MSNKPSQSWYTQPRHAGGQLQGNPIIGYLPPYEHPHPLPAHSIPSNYHHHHQPLMAMPPLVPPKYASWIDEKGESWYRTKPICDPSDKVNEAASSSPSIFLRFYHWLQGT